MNGPPLQVKIYQAIGVLLLSILSGLAVYQSPPASVSELGVWIWQPALQGLITALGALGINAGLRPK
jgi:hypothetical protein